MTEKVMVAGHQKKPLIETYKKLIDAHYKKQDRVDYLFDSRGRLDYNKG